jgi:sterol desaturase/sphingolipid hydroxylase (fatty acid hydroxylase superfamily)
VIDYFWDRLLGTYRDVESDSRASQTNSMAFHPEQRRRRGENTVHERTH